ncbi:MAG: T9SS type A sorting domain-containing protein [Bacteroidetes bacterium]|nr:T9SS type A sorting domain-containing protein [Bacteroidota bacterium]
MENSNLSIFPNPITDRSVIVCKPNEKILNFVLYDDQLRQLKEFTEAQSSLEINREGLATGIYFAKVQVLISSGISVEWLKVVVE